MSPLDIITKAEVLLEALPYIQRFQGSIFVVKYGGSFMDDPDPKVRARLAVDIVFLSAVGIHVVVVHGGGKAISRGMQRAGFNPTFVNGLRVTDKATIKIVKETLNNKVNRDICALIQAQKGHPLGILGQTLFLCQKLFERDEQGQPLDLGYVGEITAVKAELIKKAIADGYIPIISPMGEDEAGVLYNTNADSAASHVASALQARRLIYLSDVPGLLRKPNDIETLISSLSISEVEELKKSGVIAKGMLPKVNSAVCALQNGIHRVHFVDGRMPHSILLEIFTDKGIGTEVINE